jgi:hypothetical protein
MAIDNSFKTSANSFSLDSLLTGKHGNPARADNETTVCAMKLSETAQSGVATGQNSDRLWQSLHKLIDSGLVRLSTSEDYLFRPVERSYVAR